MSTAEFTLPPPYTTDRRGPARWILSHTIHQWPIVLIALSGAIANAALASFVPIYMGKALEVMQATVFDAQALLRIAIIIAISQSMRGILQFARNFGFELVAQRVERMVRQELYASLLGKSMTFHNLQPVGDTMARATNDVRPVNFLFSPGVNLVVGSINFLFVPLIVGPSYHPSLVITPLIFIILYFVLLRFYLKELMPITDEVRASFGDLNTRLNEALDGIETVKAASQEKSEIERFRANAQRFMRAMVHQGDVEARFLPALLLAVCTAAGLLHALLLFHQGLINAGAVVAYFGLLTLLGFPTFISIFAYSRISLGLAGARRILELINRENDLDQNEQGYQAEMRGEVRFENVCFAYEDGDCSVENISFSVLLKAIFSPLCVRVKFSVS
mgnify:CR=1 FL=1